MDSLADSYPAPNSHFHTYIYIDCFSYIFADLYINCYGYAFANADTEANAYIDSNANGRYKLYSYISSEYSCSSVYTHSSSFYANEHPNEDTD